MYWGGEDSPPELSLKRSQKPKLLPAEMVRKRKANLRASLIDPKKSVPKNQPPKFTEKRAPQKSTPKTLEKPGRPTQGIEVVSAFFFRLLFFFNTLLMHCMAYILDMFYNYLLLIFLKSGILSTSTYYFL